MNIVTEKKASGTKTSKEVKEAKEPKRSRTWTFIVYPESAPANWEAIIDETHLCWCHSPLHNKDVDQDPETGEPKQKKIHWHVLVQFPSKKSQKQVDNLFKEKLNCTHAQIVANTPGMLRYFVHIDNPEKAQYSFEEFKMYCHGGMLTKVESAFKSDSDTEINNNLIEIFEFIKATKICNLIPLIDALLDAGRADLVKFINTKGGWMTGKYLDAQYQLSKHSMVSAEKISKLSEESDEIPVKEFEKKSSEFDEEKRELSSENENEQLKLL